MLDDFDSNTCNGKHHGPVLYLEGDLAIMRCSFCEQIVKTPIDAAARESKRKSSRTCVSACDWVAEEKTVRCRSCSYSGPLPASDCDHPDV